MTKMLVSVPARLFRRRWCATCRAVPVERPGMVCSPQCWQARGRPQQRRAA